VLIEIASDLRLPKARGWPPPAARSRGALPKTRWGALFIGAAIFATDPRLGATAKKLVESGLPGCAGPARGRGGFARGRRVRAGGARLRLGGGPGALGELVASAPRGTRPAWPPALFSLGTAELAPAERESWAKLLLQTLRGEPERARRGETPRAPAAVAPSPSRRICPAGAGPPRGGGERELPRTPPPPAQDVLRASASPRASGRVGSPLPGRQAPKASVHAAGPPSAAEASPPAPPRSGPVEIGRKVVAPISHRCSGGRLGTVVEGPVKLPPRPMAARRRARTALGRGASFLSCRIRSFRPCRKRGASDVRPCRGPVRPQAQVPVRRPARGGSNGCAPRWRRAPRSMACPRRSRSSAVELSLPRWKGVRAPAGQLERLAAAVRAQPEPWRAAAVLLLGRLRV